MAHNIHLSNAEKHLVFDGKNTANFDSQDKAERWVKFMQGKRNSK